MICACKILSIAMIGLLRKLGIRMHGSWQMMKRRLESAFTCLYRQKHTMASTSPTMSSLLSIWKALAVSFCVLAL